jgi:hypothetical protein
LFFQKLPSVETPSIKQVNEKIYLVRLILNKSVPKNYSLQISPLIIKYNFNCPVLKQQVYGFDTIALALRIKLLCSGYFITPFNEPIYL